MEFKEFYKKYMRMCNFYKYCRECPRYEKGCLDFDTDMDALGELENDVEIWAEEHPQKTRLQDFREKYPNALLYYDGTPKPCCSDLGYCKECPEVTTCEECWNMPVEEDE